MAVAHEEVLPSASALGALPRARLGTRRLGVWLTVAGWAATITMWITGTAGTVGHDQEGVPAALATGVFLAGWLIMIAAMMLPSSLPTFGRIDRMEVEGDLRASRVMVGYFTAWSVFGAAAFVADGILHLTVEHMPWLAVRPSLIAGGIAMFAGAAELLGRTPPPSVPAIHRGGDPYALGRAHAADRIRRCWPLMLFAMAVGMSDPVWVIGLTLVMALELRPSASAMVRLVGLALVGLGVAVVVEPNWLPVLLGAG